MPVAIHELRCAEHDLAGLATRHCRRSGYRVDDAQPHVGERHADRAELLFTPRRIGDDRHLRFCERIALEDDATGCFLEPLLRFGHQRRGTAETELDRSEIDLSRTRARVVDDGVEERRNGEEERRLDAIDLVEQIRYVAGIRNENEWIVIDEREALRAGVAEGVKERERRHERVRPLEHRRGDPRL